MPYAFLLPTTSVLMYPKFFNSNTHPSLPLTATVLRNVLRNALKRFKRLPSHSRTSELGSITSAIDDYLPYLFTFDAALSGKTIGGEEVDIVLEKEVAVEWTSSLGATFPGRECPPVKGEGLDYELFSILSVLAFLYSLHARERLRTLFDPLTPTTDQRSGAIMAAIHYLLQANSVHNYLLSRSHDICFPPAAVNTSASIQSALASLTLAEATLLAVLKDDPYPAVVAQARNQNDKEWMIKAPEIPKVRAHLFARLCLAAAEHAGKAQVMLDKSNTEKGVKTDQDLVTYIANLKKTARGKACRFFGINAELGGKSGEGIAWLAGGKQEIGVDSSKEQVSKMRGLTKLRKNWQEKREDKRIESGGDWGQDAGRFEEARVIEMLEKKWNKMNDTINTQAIPPFKPLLAAMPLGRDVYSPKQYIPPTLSPDVLSDLRAPPEPRAVASANDDDDSDQDEDQPQDGLPGAFPTSSSARLAETAYY